MPLIGPGRIPTPSRKFYRQLDDTRLYTSKFVKLIKEKSTNQTERFLKMAKKMIQQI